MSQPNAYHIYDLRSPIALILKVLFALALVLLALWAVIGSLLTPLTALPRYPGATTISRVQRASCINLELAVPASVGTAYAFYRQQLLSRGWELEREFRAVESDRHSYLQFRQQGYKATITTFSESETNTKITVWAQNDQVFDECRRGQPLPIFSTTP
jgi:hypothetical protein